MKNKAARIAGRVVSRLMSGLTALALFAVPVRAQDAHTTLLLHFDDNLTGAQGEAPIQNAGVTYTNGVAGRAAVFGAGNLLRYTAANNLNPTVGTLEFWIQPQWNGSDGQTHNVLKFGNNGGGMLFAKDGANNLRSIFNQYGAGGQPEKGVAVNIGNWQAGQWHHVAYTWASAARSLELYVDGSRVAQYSFTGSLPNVSDAAFQIGADGSGNYANAALDELKISDTVRSAAEIAADYTDGLSVSSLAITPTALSLYETWTYRPALSAVTGSGTNAIPASAAVWSSSDSSIASVDSSGLIHAVRAGTAAITAAYRGVSASLALTVTAPVRAPEYASTLDPFLLRPAAGALYEMPVLIIRYLPTPDGVNVDTPIADYAGTLDSLEGSINQFNLEIKFMLEEGSRYHGYKNPNALPALGYRVVDMITVYEPLPPDLDPAHGGNNAVHQPDYNQIMARFNGQHYINQRGVKEVWLWGYHHGNIAPVESDMSSPSTGDISNSYRYNDDLPVYNKTYTLYNYNFTRSSNEAVHDHGHQLEAILGYAAQIQDGNSDFFWHKFVGQNAQNQFITGRNGWTHMPPNTTQDYDYANPNAALSDCEDWTPDGTGQKLSVSAATWGGLNYAWPYGSVPDGLTEHNWYVFMMQNMPGLDNKINYGAKTITNWWRFTGDWDNAVLKIPTEGGLYANNTASLSGTIAFESLNPLASPQTVTFLLRPVGGGTAITRTAQINAGGTYNLLGVPRGTYDVRIKGSRNLAHIVRVSLTNGNAIGANVFLPGGDADDSNVIDIADFGLLVNAYNGDASIPNSGYDVRADFNGDARVDIADFGILVNNYNLSGAP